MSSRWPSAINAYDAKDVGKDADRYGLAAWQDAGTDGLMGWGTSRKVVLRIEAHLVDRSADASAEFVLERDGAPVLQKRIDNRFVISKEGRRPIANVFDVRRDQAFGRGIIFRPTSPLIWRTSAPVYVFVDYEPLPLLSRSRP